MCRGKNSPLGGCRRSQCTRACRLVAWGVLVCGARSVSLLHIISREKQGRERETYLEDVESPLDAASGQTGGSG